jgi:hypothetical protein
MVAIRPVWPPASVPWATTMSQPASTAATAWRTFPHMLTTSTLRWWHSSTTSRGTPSPATKTVAPPSMMSLTLATMSWGAAVSRSTPNGLAVSSRTLAISSTIWSCAMVDAPMQPNPPASLTAATSRWYETPPMPASITGCSTSSTSVSRVRMGPVYQT